MGLEEVALVGQILPGVPASVRRAKVARLAEALGFDVEELRALEFRPEAIYAEVLASHPDKGPGHRYAVGGEIATHRVCIPIVDGHPDEEGMSP
ncbi:hypothetical protein [Actinomadura nitritigenes]|uniref:hypothetical protein n=1 Tax=Actinomadura nitritigenes TaxID=134602 RepID=UPI003D8BDE2F